MPASAPDRRRGFTLLELLVVSVLMCGLVMITAQLWRTFSIDMTDLAARGRAAQEMRFALENVSEDFGAAVGAVPIGRHRLLVCKDGGERPNGLADWGPPDCLVEYRVSDGQLFRHDRSSGSEMAVANDVSGFGVRRITFSLLRIVIEVRRRDATRRAVLFWSPP